MSRCERWGPDAGSVPCSSFDARLARMQTPEARAATEAAFSASPEELGKAAVRAVRGAG